MSALACGLAESWDVHVAAHGPDGALVDACEAAGLPFHHVEHLARDLEPRSDAAALRELRALADTVRPDLVQLNSSKAGVLARIALAGLGIPVVFTAHGWAFSGRGGKAGAFYTNAERACARLCQAIVCVSSWDLRLARERRIAPAHKLHLIHNGVPVDVGTPPRRVAGAELVLGCTARLAPPKDVETMLRALALPGSARWALRVFGDGPDRAQLESLRAELGLERRATFLGSRDDVTAQLADCDAFALISDWEGLPYSILEAMAARLPVIATRVGGIPDLIVEGSTGRLIPPRDPAALADALTELADEPARALAYGQAGLERASRAFSLERMLGRYDALFRSLI